MKQARENWLRKKRSLDEFPEEQPSGAKQAAEKLDPEGGAGFNPRIKPTLMLLH